VLNKSCEQINNTEVRAMPYTTTNILSPNKEIYNYINDVNYGMSVNGKIKLPGYGKDFSPLR
jgi:hypothetical protein